MASPTDNHSDRRILIPVDGSEHSERAFQWYIDRMRRPGDCVWLLHVHPSPYAVMQSFGMPMMVSVDELDKLKAERERHNAELESQYAAIAKKNDMTEYHFKTALSGEPGPTITEKANEMKSDVIVMGSRGLGKLRRTFLGSVSDYVLHHAGKPISIIPPPKPDHKKTEHD